MAKLQDLPLIAKQLFAKIFQPFIIYEQGIEDLSVNNTPQRITYDRMMEYYLNQNLYDTLMNANQQADVYYPNKKGFGNPVYRSCEFFASKIMPGDALSLGIITENQRIVDPVHQIMSWSNFNAQKTRAARLFSIYGDLFTCVTTNAKADQVILKFVKPQTVTDWVEDDRGNIRSLRTDVFLGKGKWRTDYWDEERYITWEHSRGIQANLSALGEGTQIPLSTWGIDFVPWRHLKFLDIGNKRGNNCFVHALDKIQVLDLLITDLYENMMENNYANWALEPVGTLEQLKVPTLDADTFKKYRKELKIPPSGYKFVSNVPDLKYQEQLAVIQDQRTDIEKTMPELTLPDLKDQAVSGRAIERILGNAASRVKESNANWNAGLVATLKMGLSVGMGLDIFSNIGNYDAGDFEFSFEEQDAFPLSEQEKVTIEKTRIDGIVAAKNAGFNSKEELDKWEESQQK